tara:strand:- start:97 stop:957 length:861 start_codon:yes stop_codon:yes gene_type:complete
MKIVKYLIQFLIILILFFILKIFGYKYASNIGGFIGSNLGPLFRSKKTIRHNLNSSLPDLSETQITETIKEMWSNYGRILSDYMYIKKFRHSKLDDYIKIDGSEVFEEIKKNKKPVIFISGHFNNFELMAMEIEKFGINVAAVYRPLNNLFLNKIMEFLRKKYICKYQIKKGFSGLRDMIYYFKKDYSIAIMIDQRVSEGINSNLFNRVALTTTIPAQFVKKFNCKIVPIYIERINKYNYRMKINEPLEFKKEDSIGSITQKLNIWLEEMIKKNPSQWIWSHNRWK